jgi:hypothetical protein
MEQPSSKGCFFYLSSEFTRMRIIIQSILLAVIVWFPLSSFTQKPAQVGFSKLEGYFVKPGMEPKSGLNTQLFARKAQFDEYFISKVTPGKKITQLDFNRYVVLVCMSAKTNIETTMKLEKVLKKNGTMEIYFTAVYGKKLASPIIPACFYTTAIDKSLSGMVYYINGKLVQDVQN